MKANTFGGFKAGISVLFGLMLALCGWVAASKLAAKDATGPSDVASSQAPAPDPALPIPNAAPDSATPLLSLPAQELVRLAQNGAGEDAMLSYVGNSTAPFKLTPDHIIYLNDIGVPQEVITGMIQRDTALAPPAAAQPAIAPSTAAPTPAGPPTETQDLTAPQPPPFGAPPGPAYITDQSVAQPPDVPPSPEYVAEDNSASDASAGYFYNSLAPYGSWFGVSGYGLCWRPTVMLMNPTWKPYWNGGHWINTDVGWYWQSDYTWGWAPFHYGRWFFTPQWGWVWQANSLWSPAWVAWRQSLYYSGWAPLPPEADFALGRGFRYRHRAVDLTFDFGLPSSAFNFVPTAHLADKNPQPHRVAPMQVAMVFNQTKLINNITAQGKRVVNPGIDPATVATASHKEIKRVALMDLPANAGPTERPGRLDRTGTTLTVWRPEVPESSDKPGTARAGNAAPPGLAVPRPPQPGVNAAPVPLPANNRAVNPAPPALARPLPVRQPATTVLPGPRQEPAQREPNDEVAQPAQRFGQPPANSTARLGGPVRPTPPPQARAPAAYPEPPAYIPPPAHIAPPQENYQANRYEPAYTPPPAYRPPPAEAEPARHSQPVESRPAPPAQAPANSPSQRGR